MYKKAGTITDNLDLRLLDIRKEADNDEFVNYVAKLTLTIFLDQQGLGKFNFNNTSAMIYRRIFNERYKSYEIENKKKITYKVIDETLEYIKDQQDIMTKYLRNVAVMLDYKRNKSL